MTFDKWIDAVNAQVRFRLGNQVRTEELSSDSAVWRSARGTAVASLADDGVTAKVFFDGGDKLTLGFNEAPEAHPDALSSTIAERLAAR
ncbi:MAG: hypothetical protein IAI49_13535 [Candidatus Eremiobacteraeota bacterium]|nr:hypothetical protein [Candidatus Eremiobacteraeota bacterium]